jgi:ABC-2 type transport system ATP-binding protein
MADPVLRIERLTKNYGRVRALHDVSFEVGAGEVFGLLGPNGAGKTTLLRTLLDLIRPTSGTIEVFGHDSVRESVAVRARCAYLPGDFVVPARLTGFEAIDRYTFARRDGARSVAARLADRIDLDLSRRVGDLSKGNRQKVGLVLAFSTPADLLVLDEPTSGLDPLLQRTFRDLVRERQDEGTAVLLSSHVLDEVEHLAQRVGVLRLGELMLIDTVAHLLDQASRALRLRFADADAAAAATGDLVGVQGVSSVVRDAATVQLRVTGSVDALLKTLARHTTLGLDEVSGDLQDAFIALYASGAEEAS